jgi:Predicted permeases
LGSSLAGYRLSGSIAPAILISVLKNLLQPLLVFGVGYTLGLEPLWLSVAVLLAAMPTGVNMYLFASRYDVSPPTATTSILISTVSGIVTLSLVIGLLKLI